MKTRIVSLAIISLAMAVVPLSAQTLYENGPINGTTDAWPITFGFVASNSFTLLTNSTVGGFDLGIWEFPGDTVNSATWAITSLENGGTIYGSGTITGKNITDQFLSVNSFGFDVDKVSLTGLNVALSAQTYWLNLQNVTVPSGDPVYWDENSGVGCQSSGCPSLASESLIGTVPSESFTIVGSGGGTTPEPSSILLFASGILGLAGVLRRRLF